MPNKLFVGDLKQIEARKLCWFTGQTHKLDLYRQDVDFYCIAASPIFGRIITPADKTERQTGKVSELALGFGGGIGAYGNMAGAYKLDLNVIYKLLWHTATDEEADKAEHANVLYLSRHRRLEKRAAKKNKQTSPPLPTNIALVCDLVKQRWRKENPEAVEYWAKLDYAAKFAVKSGQVVKVQMPGTVAAVQWFMHKQFLVCRLPSGRDIFYPFPKVGPEPEDTDDDETIDQDDADALVEFKRGERLTYRRIDPNTKQWVRTSTYGGKECENIVQASARDVLVYAMLRLEAAGFPAILHAHDEDISEVPESADIEEFKRIFAEPLEWTEGLPIAVDAWEGIRYDKH